LNELPEIRNASRKPSNGLVVIGMNAAPETEARPNTVRALSGRLDEVGPDERPLAVVAGNDSDLRERLIRALEHPSLCVVEARSTETVQRLLESDRVDTLLVQDGFDGSTGVDLLARTRKRCPDVRRVLVSAGQDAGVMCEAVNRAGIAYLLGTPWSNESIERIRQEILAGAAPERHASPAAVDESSPGHIYGIVGRSPAIVGLVDLIERVARTDSPVLITGETGTGKELVGHAIHRASHRAKHAFSAINSAAVPESLLESELFGHRKGAFTGANANRKGLFEQASQGTVFLDELAEMPLTMQAKLLRFLQTGEIRPVGGETTRSVDVRLVSATNKSLEEEVAAGRFREDLYYRLAVIPIAVPALRERAEDVPLLAEYFLQRALRRTPKVVQGFDAEAIAALAAHSWPGNVRELQNVVERGVALCRGEQIGVADLQALHLRRPVHDDVHDIQSLPGLERRHILETLDRVGWNRKKAASLLKISTTTLWRRLKEFGIEGTPGRGRANGMANPAGPSRAGGGTFHG